jgi:hypothetical protein
MAHFAEIDENNIVIRVLVVSDADAVNGQTFLAETLNLGGRWIQTSYNANIRYNFAGIGYTYDEARDAFISPKPDNFTDEEGNSFTLVLNEETCKWEALLLS